MTKQDICNAASEIKILLRDRECKDGDRLEFLKKTYGSFPAISQIFDDDYDRKVTHSGFGAPNCSCHIAPPCSSCISFTQAQWCVEENNCEKCKVYVANAGSKDNYWECEITDEP